MLYSETELKKRLKSGCPVFYFYASDEALVRSAAATPPASTSGERALGRCTSAAARYNSSQSSIQRNVSFLPRPCSGRSAGAGPPQAPRLTAPDRAPPSRLTFSPF